MNLCRVTGLFQYLSTFSNFLESSSQPQERLILAPELWEGTGKHWKAILSYEWNSNPLLFRESFTELTRFCVSPALTLLVVMTQSELEILEACRQFWVQKSAPTTPFWLLAAGLHQNMIFFRLSNIHIITSVFIHAHNYIVSCSVCFLETTTRSNTCFHFFPTSLDPLKSACFIFFLNFWSMGMQRFQGDGRSWTWLLWASGCLQGCHTSGDPGRIP